MTTVAPPPPAAPAAGGARLFVRVYGTPAPQGSKRAIPLRNGRVNLVESSARVAPWREAVRSETQRAILTGPGRHCYPVAAPVRVAVTFWVRRPAGHYGTGRNAATIRPAAPLLPGVKPDLDKLIRSTLDALTGVAIADDALITAISARKLYALPGCGPGAAITIRQDTPADA